MWFAVCAVVVLGIAALIWAMRRMRHDLPALVGEIDALHRDVRPALVRVRTQTEAARARLVRE